MNRSMLPAIAAVLLAAGAASAGPLAPDDPYYITYEWYGPRLGLPAAWEYSQGSSSVTVAVLDTGVMTGTPDLAGRLLPPLSTPLLPNPLDGTTNHHGTWVASVIAMGVNNGIGGAGVGNFSILPITVTAPDGSNASSWIAGGIRTAADAGARVINVSHSTVDYGQLDSAAAYARSKGALVFVAAGNTDQRSGMTGYDNLVFVAGTDSSDGRWSNAATGKGSTWGPFVDLSAPAADILVADPTFGSGYGLGSGTSFSTALASGAAALAWSINPNLSADDVLSLMYGTAVDLGTRGRDDVFGYGRIDIGALAAAAGSAVVPEPATLTLLGAGLVVLAVRRRRRG